MIKNPYVCETAPEGAVSRRGRRRPEPPGGGAGRGNGRRAEPGLPVYDGHSGGARNARAVPAREPRGPRAAARPQAAPAAGRVPAAGAVPRPPAPAAAAPAPSSGRGPLRRALRALSTALMVAAVVLAAALVGVRLVGLDVYAVLSGSMEPTYHVGSVIYVRDVDPADLEAGDVITFMLDEDTVATHRVVEVVPDEEDPSVLRFRTKGDANDAVDGSLVHCRNVVGTPVFTVPYLGHVADYVQGPPGCWVALAACALLVMLTFLPDLFAKEEDGEDAPPARAAAAAAPERPARQAAGAHAAQARAGARPAVPRVQAAPALRRSAEARPAQPAHAARARASAGGAPRANDPRANRQRSQRAGRPLR